MLKDCIQKPRRVPIHKNNVNRKMRVIRRAMKRVEIDH